MNTILILGDSSSMTFGLEQHTYPSFLAQQKIWTENTQIINGSQPGFTSAGICAFYFQHLSKFPKLSAVIIYIGNNDGVSTKIRQGKYTRMKHYYFQIRKLLNLQKSKNKYTNILTPYEWNNNVDLSTEQPESTSDFKYNLERIFKSCFKRHTHIYLIKPLANSIFPAGLGKGNFIFYRYISLFEELADKLKISDDRFLIALRLQEKGKYEKAQKIYQEILDHQKYDGQNLEFFLMIVNNYAIAAAQIGKLEEAELLLEIIKNEINSRKEIYLFNLSQIYRLKKEYGKYEKYLKLAYEADQTVYRIKKPYLDVLDELGGKYKNHLTVIDLRESCNKNDFVDYCHLIPDAHLKLAKVLSRKIKKITKGYQSASIQNILTNPELAFGNSANFNEYLEVYSNFTEEEIKKNISLFKSKLSNKNHKKEIQQLLNQLPKEYINAFNFYLSTPFFSSYQEILRFAPKYSFDIGRFPEYYLYRHEISYLKIFETIYDHSIKFSSKYKLLRNSNEIISLLPTEVLNKVLFDKLIFEEKFDKSRRDNILQKIKNQLLIHLEQGNQIHKRLKTTIYWYFRESLRFGFHSRISMRYDRLFLEYCAEALVIAMVLDSKLERKRNNIIDKIISWLEDSCEIHQKYSSEFTLENNNVLLLKEYDNRLKELATRIKKTNFIL